MRLDKDYIWECDYGIRKPLIPIIKKLLREQDATSLQMITLFANNIPYCLEFYIVVSYDDPKEGHIKSMIEEFSKMGIKYRPDITFEELIHEKANRRFNSGAIASEDLVDFYFDSEIFKFVEKDELAQKGYIIKPLGKKKSVFLSHSSKDKKDVENLIPYLNGAGLPVWFDSINIDYGESITEAIERGIDQSGAAIFWITKNFLDSNWCKTERRNFSSRHSAYNDIILISIVSDDIDIRTEMPTFLRDLKAFIRGNDENLDNIANEILPSLRRYFNEKERKE